MKRRNLLAAPAALVIAVPGHATIYLTVEQAQEAIFPGASFVRADVTLTDEQRNAIEEASGVDVRNQKQQVWKVGSGGWLIVDEVLGKHEFITYAVGLTPDGKVRGIEVLAYRETHGYQIRAAEWRQKFVGKTLQDPFKLDEDIPNIAGATLSCYNVTNGVKRLLALQQLVLSHGS